MERCFKLKIALFIFLILIATPFSAYSTDGQIKITQTSSTAFPITINKPGSYVLTSNLKVDVQDVHAIEITVNDVTLDLNGFTIQGPNVVGTGSGIRAYNQYNIAIENGRVWGFLVGIDLHPSGQGAGHRLEGIQAANNTIGIIVYGGMAINCITNNNAWTGILANNSIISNCTTNNNGLDGIQSENSVVTHCTASYNQLNGINAAVGQSRIEGNNVRDNGSYGISLSSAGNEYVIQNVASDNAGGNFSAGSGDNYLPLSGVNANYGF